MTIRIATIPRRSTLQVKERETTSSNENYSSPLINFVESVRIDGVDYTKFYTRVDTNLNVGDKVYIVNGNYDNYDIIKENPYRMGTNGYVILQIDKSSITLDIEYTDTSVWDSDYFDNYIKIYGCDTPQRSQYEVLQNGYYPYKYTYGYRGNNNILYCSTLNQFLVADPYNDISDINNWTDITSGLLSNTFPILSGNSFTSNNGKVIIMDDFTYNGVDYKKGYVYKYENGKWIIDNKSRKSYLSRGSFRDGRFSDGNWNDGIFGQIDKKVDWTGAEWNNGILFNSNWTSGVMGSKSDSISRQSYYSFLDEGQVKQTTDFNNNSGFGYNFVDDSHFDSITIDNVNANNCTFGSYSATQSFLKRYLLATQSDTDFGFNINIKNGNYIDSMIEDALISYGVYEFSDIDNSHSLDGRFIDTNIVHSIASGDYEGMGTIEIVGYEKLLTSNDYIFENPYNTATASTNCDRLVVNHKFYISEDNFTKIKAGSWINLNQLITNNPDILNFLENSFYIGSDKNGELYVADNYGDRSSVVVHMNSKEQNSKIKTIPNANQFPNLVETTRSNPLPSIDLFVEFDSISAQISQDFENIDATGFGIEDDYGWSITNNGGVNQSLIANSSFDNNEFTSPIRSLLVTKTSAGSGSLSIETPCVENVDTLEYSVSTLGSGTFGTVSVMGFDTVWNTIGTDVIAFNPATYSTAGWNVNSHSISGTYSKLRLDIEMIAFPIQLLKIDDIVIDGNLTVFGNSALDSYRNETLTDPNYLMNVADFQDTTLQVANINKTIYNGGTWKASKVNNADYIINRTTGTQGNFGEYLSMTFSGTDLQVELKDFSNILYDNQLEIGDVIAIDNISYDLSGVVSPVDGLYTLATYSESPLTLTLEDLGTQSIAGSFLPGGDFISSFIVENGTYSLQSSQDIFNSIHLEKIQDTTINQGFIKRELFESNLVSNDNFEIQTEFDLRNVNRLKVSEMLLDDSNYLTVESGLFIRTFIKDTDWDNGIIYRSVLKNLNVSDGVIKQSKWISGTFGGGIFLDARKDSISDPSDSSLQFATVQISSEWDNGEFTGGEFFDGIWDDGNFRGGKFYNAIFAAGSWYDGEFGDTRYNNSDTQFAEAQWTHNSVNLLGSPVPTWYDGLFTKGEFGLRERYQEPVEVLTFAGTNVNTLPLGGTGVTIDDDQTNIIISDDIITLDGYGGIDGIYSVDNIVYNSGTNKTEYSLLSPPTPSFAPPGSEISFNGIVTLPHPTIGTMSWYNGTFKDGTIQSYTSSSPVIWYDGTFNNGDIIGYIQWKDGTFNQGKFRSSFGDGYGTYSTNYAWVDGIFNNGRFGDTTGSINVGLDGGVTYSNPSWFNGRFNDGFFYGKFWNDGVFTGGRFIGNTQSSFNPFFYETWTPDASVISNHYSLPYPTFLNFDGDLGVWDSQITSYPFPLPNPSIIRITTRIEQSSTFSLSTNPYSLIATMNPSSIVLGAGGISILTHNYAYITSPIIEDSIDSLEISYEATVNFSINIAVNATVRLDVFGTDYDGNPFNFTDTEIVAMPPNISTINTGILKFTQIGGYPANARYRFRVEFSGISFAAGTVLGHELKLDDFRFNVNTNNKEASRPDQFVMDYSEDSTVEYFGMWRNGKVLSDNTVAVSESNFVKLSQLESVRRFKGETSPKIFFENALWVGGEFEAFGIMNNCVWLDGSFKNGRFENSSFNPYVPRWNFYEPGGTTASTGATDSSTGRYSYELTDSCIWKSGYLNNSQFSISDWQSGVFNNGDMIGGHFQQGVANYINAYNCVWESGTWRNGNWYGSNYDKSKLFNTILTPDGFGGTDTTFRFKQSNLLDILVSSSKRLGIGITGSNELFLWNAFDNSTGPMSYSDTTTYTYYDFGAPTTSDYSNNDFITFGNISGVTAIGSTSSSLIENRLIGLNFENPKSGYKVGNNLDLFWLDVNINSVIQDSEDTNGASLTSKWGNGSFVTGVWENGVWNNGARLDESFQTESTNAIMDEVSNFFQVSPDRWQVKFKGSESISNFKLGDHISIGNIVGLSVNSERKFLKDSYQVIDISQNDNTISVIIKTTFPLRSIERDSENHKIYITKNVWENGTFHNGRFDGVWNSGTFRGYPEITKMENTYWIDGTLNGGRFVAATASDLFSVEYSTGLIQNANLNLRNVREEDLYETWIDVNFDDTNSDFIWSRDNLVPPVKQDTTNDVLSTDTTIWVGVTSSVSRTQENLKLGVKFSLFDELIGDDLNAIFAPERLEDRGWSFHQDTFLGLVPLNATQSKFLGTDGNGQPLNLMRIDTINPPIDGTFSADDVYTISHDNLNTFDKFRYWEASYDIVDRDALSGNDAFISPYPIAPFGSGDTSKYVTSTVRAYHWNKNQGTPIISLGLTVVGEIDNIKFTEVDSIPFHNYSYNGSNVDTSLKLAITSIADVIEISETDSKFIDNK